MNKLAGIVALLIVIGLMFFAVSRPEHPSPRQTASDSISTHATATSASASAVDKAAFGHLPMHFEEGDPAAGNHFTAKGPGYRLALLPSEAVLRLRPAAGAEQATLLRMRLVGANPIPAISGREELPGKSNYLFGNDPEKWRTNVPNYSKVFYEGVYPGIDVVYYGNPQQLEYDFIVAPSADPEAITLDFDGVERMTFDEAGNLAMVVDGGEVVQHAPVSYQEINGTRQPVASRYVRKDGQQIGFEVGHYDPGMPLVIDPELVYSTFLGGSNQDIGWGITTDREGNVYITGETESVDFPTMNPFQAPATGGLSKDIFITKINPEGTAILYSTHLGGGFNDIANAIAVDDVGHVVVTGYTRSTANDGSAAVPFPITPGAFVERDGNAVHDNGFLTKLTPNGDGLVYSTFLAGGADNTRSKGLVLDEAGNAIITGETDDKNMILVNPLQDELKGPNGWSDAFVMKFDGFGQPIFSTFLGGESGFERGTGVALDAAGNIYLTGSTSSSDFPLQNPFQPAHSGGDALAYDGYIATLSADGQVLLFASYFGDSGDDFPLDLAVDQAGNAYITGRTLSTTFPIANALQPTYGGGEEDAFLVKVNADGTRAYATYLGGNGTDQAYSIVLDANGNALLTGSTASSDFPLQDPRQATNGGGTDVFITQVQSDGSTLLYSTYFGNSNDDAGHAITAGPGGAVYLTGGIFSLTFDPPAFPIENALQPTPGGGFREAFVVRMDFGGANFGLSVGLDLDQCINPDGSKRSLLIRETQEECELSIDGVAINLSHSTEQFGPRRSFFKDLTITGTNLEQVIHVRFEPGNEMVVSNVRATETEVTFDLEVFLFQLENESEFTETGERDLILVKQDNTEINVSQQTGQPFIVSMISHGFTQGGSSRESSFFHNPLQLITEKAGAVRIQILDNKLNGEIFKGFLFVKGKDPVFSEEPRQRQDSLVVKDFYSTAETLDGRSHLTMPFPNDIEAGVTSWSCALISNAGTLLLCPEVFTQTIETNSLDILGLRIRVVKPDGTVLEPAPVEHLREAVAFMQDVYPISSDRLTFIDAGEMVLGPNVEYAVSPTVRLFEEGADQLFALLGRARRATNKQTGLHFNVIVGIVPSGFLPGNSAGGARAGECAVLLDSEFGDLITSLAHEVGHALKPCLAETSTFAFEPGERLGDEYEGGTFRCEANPPIRGITGVGGKTCPHSPFQAGSDGTDDGIFVKFGYDPLLLEPRHHSDTRPTFNIMGRALSDPRKSWVSTSVYDIMSEWLVPSPSASKTIRQEPILTLRGTIFDDDSAVFDNFDLSTGGFPAPASEGPYTLELQDAANTILAEQAFDADFFLHVEPPIESDKAFFSIRMDQPDGAKQVVLKKNGDELTRRILSDNPPVVAFTAPSNGQALSGTIELAWTASDPDGDALTYSLFLLPDGSEAFLPVDVGLNETSYMLDTSFFSQTSNATLKIVASDGFREGEATVMLGTGSGVAPVFASTSPANAVQGATGVMLNVAGQNFTDGTTVSFSGSGITVTSVTQHTDTALQIAVDVAPNATPGPRDLTVTNPGGLTTTAVGAFEVLAQGSLTALLRWDPPAPGETLVPPGNLRVDFGSGTMAGKQAMYRSSHRLNRSRRASSAGKHQAPSRMRTATHQIDEIEPNNHPDDAQVLTGSAPVTVNGNVEVDDEGLVTINFGDGLSDDLEDLFRVTITEPGLILSLDGFTSDTDLYLIDEEVTTLLDASDNIGASEAEFIEDIELPVGTYVIGVSIYDPDPIGGPATPYTLTVLGTFEGDTGDPPVLLSYNIYRSLAPDPFSSGTRIATADAMTTTYLDALPSDGMYHYQVTAVYDQGESDPSDETVLSVAVAVEEETAVPTAFVLAQNYPNPFNPKTTIPYEIETPGRVLLQVFNVLGQHVQTVVDSYHAPGRYEVSFDARGLPSGLYLYQLEAGSNYARQTMLLLK